MNRDSESIVSTVLLATFARADSGFEGTLLARVEMCDFQ